MKSIIEMRTSLRSMLVLVAGITASGAVLADYVITDLGTLGGTNSYAMSINDSGQIAGYSLTAANNGYHAFLYDNGVMIDLGVSFGGSSAGAEKINASGQIVGWAQTTGNASQHGFLYDNGVVTDLGTLGGDSVAFGINDSGDIVGWSNFVSSGATRAFFYSAGTMTDLGTYNSWAYSINNNGEVVGRAYGVNPSFHAFLYTNGVMHDLGTLGGSQAEARDINDNGQIVGSSETASNTYHAFVYSNGTMSDLGSSGVGFFSQAFAINNNGDIVGSNYSSTTGVGYAVLFSGGVMQDLNSLLPSGSGWALREAHDINDSGQIVGVGVIDGVTHAFVMTPVPPGGCG